MEGAPQFFGRVKRHTLAARHRFHDTGHAGRIAPVHPDNVDAQFVHTRILPTCEKNRGEAGTYCLQMRIKAHLQSARPLAGEIGIFAGSVAKGQKTENIRI